MLGARGAQGDSLGGAKLPSMDSMRSVNPGSAHLVRGIHGGNLQPVSQALAEHSAGVVDSLQGSYTDDMAKDLKALKVAVNMEQMGRAGAAQCDSATAYMVAGSMLNAPGVGGMFQYAVQSNLKAVVSNPQRLKEFAGQVVDAQASAPPQLDSLNNRVTSALVKEGVKPGNVPTALFMAGALLENDQNRGLLPGS